LVHISEMSWTRNVRHPSKVVSIGETIEAVVLKVDESEEKISLGMKQTEQDPWMVLPLKYPVDTRITGKVRNLTSFGAFVEIEAGIDGLIHISDMSWTKRVQHPSEVINKGDEVEVVILNIDGDNKRISLGLKQAEEDPWLKIGETLPIGTELKGHAVRLMDKGIVIDIGDDLEGFAPMSQLGLEDTTDPSEAVIEGQPLEVKVLEVDPIHHRIVVAVINYPEFTEADLVKRAPIPELEDDEIDDEARDPGAPSTDDAPEVPAESASAESVEEVATEEPEPVDTGAPAAVEEASEPEATVSTDAPEADPEAPVTTEEPEIQPEATVAAEEPEAEVEATANAEEPEAEVEATASAEEPEAEVEATASAEEPEAEPKAGK